MGVGLRSAFSFEILSEKKASAVAEAFLCLFAGIFKGCFEKCVFFAWCFCGEVVVDSW